MVPQANLPVVDVGGRGASERDLQNASQCMDEAFREVGFCYVVNTGVADDVVSQAFAASQRFHAQSDEVKQRVAINEFHRGYMAPKTSLIKTSSVAKVTRPNLSESLMFMHEVHPSDPAYGAPLQGPNQWPQGLPGFRTAIELYQQEMAALAHRIMRIMERALGLRANYLSPFFEKPTTWLRLLHYPPQPRGDDEQFGAAPHTDYGFMTVLAQDKVGGLQVRDRSGQWIDAPPLPGGFVLNVADMLARWTNDRWTSTPHRVVNHSPHDRFSLPFFWDMSMDAKIVCLPTCHDESEKAKYEPVVFGDYVMERLNKNYSYRAKLA